MNLVDPDGKFWNPFGAIWGWFTSETEYNPSVNFSDFYATSALYWYAYAYGKQPPQPHIEVPQIPASLVNEQKLPEVYKNATSALSKPECAAVFGTRRGSSATTILDDIISGIGGNKIVFKDLGGINTAATTQPNIGIGSVIRRIFAGSWSSVTITINSHNSEGYWNSLGLVENTNILLHELGHALADMGFSGGTFVHNDTFSNDPDKQNSAQNQNRELIMKNCLN